MNERPTLRALLARTPGIDTSGERFDVAIDSVEIDSRSVKPGALFVALAGERFDGHDFIGHAIENGAVGVVCGEAPAGRENQHSLRSLADTSPRSPGSVALRDFESIDSPARPTFVLVSDTRIALSSIASIFFGEPSRALRVVGVTGTNGKTTATHMIAKIFEEAGFPAGVIGTLGGHFRDREWKLVNTTPLALELQHLLAEMRDAGARGAAMEVSSHALALERVRDVRFAVGAFTNLTRDHLDFHETFEAYAAAKHHLFEMSERCVFNLDDEWGARWAAEFSGKKPLLTYAVQDTRADLMPNDIELRGDGSTFILEGTRFTVRIPGTFNVANALCAIACARLLDISDEISARGLAMLERVSGRMEHIHGINASIDVVVDYAHTPDSLQNVLLALRGGVAHGASLTVVFGCGGNRDRGKRPLMGDIAMRLADRVYVTNDNPRTEDPQTIAEEILAQCHPERSVRQDTQSRDSDNRGISTTRLSRRSARYDNLVVELDRRKAIERAIAEAQPGDTVLIAGKGHEDYQIIGNMVFPFDDTLVAREALRKREASSR